MPSSWKCPDCGLVNFASAANCKRCHAVAPQPHAQSVPPQAAGITLEDGYVLPPPPTSGGIWRDGQTLVVVKEALLPDRCVRCNAPANGYRLRRRLAWHNPLFFVLIFVGILFYVILAVVFSKRATVDFGLCENHVRRRRTLLLIGWIWFVLCLIIPVVAFSYNYGLVGLIAILLFFAAIVWLVLAYRIVNVKLIDDRYVWLTGINEQYLLQFPPAPTGPAPATHLTN